MKAEVYCQQKAAPAGSSLYYSTLFHSPQQKRKLHAVFALQQELVDTIAECQDVGVARIKLQWWHEEIERLFSSQARHPVTRALQELLPELELEQDSLLNLVYVVESEISFAQKDSLEQLIEYFSAGRGTTWQMAAFASGCQDSETIAQIVKIGGLSTCLNFIQFARQQLIRGRCPYPLIEMQKYGLNLQTFLQQDKLPVLSQLHTELCVRIGAELSCCAKAITSMDRRSVLFALTTAHIAMATCELIQKQRGDMPAQPVSLSPLRKLWIAWRLKS